MDVYEVRYFEPAKQTFSDFPTTLKSRYNHPARYRICKTYKYPNGKFGRCGAEGLFSFVDGKCSNFLGEYQAEILGRVANDRSGEADRFEPA